MLDSSACYHLQLTGRPCTGEAAIGPATPLGDRVFLQGGSLADLHDGLGPTNRSAIALPCSLLTGRWLIETYELYSQPSGGMPLLRLPLGDQLVLDRPRLPVLPPGAIQPAESYQPLFSQWRLERNPCPGWAERVHLYQRPGKPFEANAVVYLNQAHMIAAAELLHCPLIQADGSLAPARRVWINFSRSRTS